MVVHPDTIISRSKRDPIFYIAGQQILTTDCYTYLGILFGKYLSLDSVIKVLNSSVFSRWISRINSDKNVDNESNNECNNTRKLVTVIFININQIPCILFFTFLFLYFLFLFNFILLLYM